MQDAYAKGLCQNCPHGKVAFFISSCVTIYNKDGFNGKDYLILGVWVFFVCNKQ